MTQLTPEKIAELDRVADAATDGEWGVYMDDDCCHGVECDLDKSVFSRRIIVGADTDNGMANQVHIATFDPPTVKMLLARVRELSESSQRHILWAKNAEVTVVAMAKERDQERDQLRTQLEKVRGQRDYELREKEKAIRGLVDSESERDQLRARVEELEEYQHKYEDLCK